MLKLPLQKGIKKRTEKERRKEEKDRGGVGLGRREKGEGGGAIFRCVWLE